jgi:hypothetical protein
MSQPPENSHTRAHFDLIAPIARITVRLGRACGVAEGLYGGKRADVPKNSHARPAFAPSTPTWGSQESARKKAKKTPRASKAAGGSERTFA